MDVVRLGAFLKELRKEHGLTQEQLAEKLGVTNRTVSRWETGSNLPDLDILIELSEFYQIDIKELLNGERKMEEAEMEDTKLILQVAEYSTMKEAHLMSKIFSVVVAGVAAIGVLFYTMLKFFNDVTGSGIVLLSPVIAFLIYNITMQAFREHRSAVGYRLTLLGGFCGIIVSNLIILFLFFGSGTYHNYGLAGFFYVLAIVIVTFIATSIIIRSLIKRQAHSVNR